jgi:hypothetical protein
MVLVNKYNQGQAGRVCLARQAVPAIPHLPALDYKSVLADTVYAPQRLCVACGCVSANCLYIKPFPHPVLLNRLHFHQNQVNCQNQASHRPPKRILTAPSWQLDHEIHHRHEQRERPPTTAAVERLHQFGSWRRYKNHILNLCQYSLRIIRQNTRATSHTNTNQYSNASTIAIPTGSP